VTDTAGRTIAVTGGTGFVGRALIGRALIAGVAVRALARRPQAPRSGVTWVPGDLADAQALNRLASGAEAVIHVAGLTTAPDPAGFDAGNVDGTCAVLVAAEAQGARRFVFVSSLSAREPGLSAYGASKAKAEAVVSASGLEWTIVRPPAVYGPHDSALFELFRAAKWGVVPVPAPDEGQARASVIHVDDLARLLLALAEAPGVDRRCFEPDDGVPGGWDQRELARAIGAAMGRSPRVLRVPRRWMERAAWLDGRLRGADAKLTPDRVGYLTHPDWVVGGDARVPPALWQPLIETRAGLAATARWYRAAGWL
jgi:nucleoside-diphosphate-sugar epimerase